MIEELAGPKRKKWTRSELHAIRDSGAIDVTRLELIDGDLLDKAGQPFRSAQARHRIVGVLARIFHIDQIVPNCTIEVAPSDRTLNEPEPDVLVLNRGLETLTDWPQGHELILIVEVAETTLAFDLSIRASLYSRAGIVDYWVVDLDGRRVFVHRQPENGRYASVVSYDVNESVTPLAAREHRVAIRRLFSE